MRGRGILLVFLACLVFFSGATVTFAQGGTAAAQLNGTVTDASGASVSGAAIAVRNTDTNTTYTATSTERGSYAIINLPPGNYELKTTFTGFSDYTQTGIVLTVGQSATINVGLQVASQGARVVVTTEVQTIEPTKTEISQVVNTEQIASLPTSGRLFTDFALLTPGVTTSRTALGTTFTEYEATQVSFGGMRSFSNEITVDGADFVNTISGVQRSTPPQESVQEFRVVNNSFGAEYSRALGGIVNIVTKSGTNDLHGSIYDFLQNSAADSRSLLQQGSLPNQLRQNQFGGTIGGPVKKDKTFFFANYEGKRRAESPTYPPDLINNIGTIDTAKAYLGLAPEGCTLALASCTRSNLSYLNAFLKTVDNDYGFVRLDHEINTNNRLAVRYVVEDARDSGELVGQTLDGGGIGTPSGGRNLFIRDQSLVGTLDSVITPNVVNTALVQYARRHYNFPGATGQPDLSVVNDLELGHNFGTYDAIYESRVEGADSVSWVKGNHVWKFGFDGNYVWSANNYPGFTPERILLPNLGCLDAFANFVQFGNPISTAAGALGGAVGCPLSEPGATATPTNCAITPSGCGADGVAFLYLGVALPRTGFANGYVPLPATGAGFGSAWPNAFPTNQYQNYAYTLNHGYWGFFAQDQWRITPKLTFNYGLRWDLETGLSNEIDTDYNGWQPRVGLAWSPNNKTVVRAGFGMFDDRQNLTFFFTTGNQKTIPGYLCQPVVAGCTGHTSVTLPMVRTGAQNGGWQLNGVPGFPAIPADATAGLATSILEGAAYPAAFLSGPCPPACGVGAGGMDRHHTRTPYAEQASVEIDRQLGRGLSLNVGYLFVAAHKLIRGNNINVPCPVGTSKPGAPADVQGLFNANATLSSCTGTPMLGPLGLGPFFASLANPSGLETTAAGLLDYNNGVANAVYHGGTITVIDRVKYFSMTANYTYSHTIDNGNFTTFINLPQNQFDYKAERANSNQDARHHFVANFTATAPNDSFLRHFEFSSIITLQSGRPFTLFSGENTFGDLAGSSTDRVGGTPVVGVCTSSSNCTTTIGRNTYTGDPLYAWDLRVSRYFQLTERMKLDLMVDAFNVLNRANVDEVTSVYGSPVFCGATPAIPRHYNDTITQAIQSPAGVSCGPQIAASFGPAPGLNFPGGAFLADGLLPVAIPGTPNSTFGRPRTMLNPRQFQFSAKFTF